MKFKLTSLAALALIVGFAHEAGAQTPQIYFGVHGGKSLANSELSNPDSTFVFDGAGLSGYGAGVHIGADLQLKDSPVFAGIFAGYDWQNTEFGITAPGFTFNSSLGNSWYAGGRAGFVIFGAKAYGLAAYRQTEWDNTVKELSSPELKGFDLGVGVEIPVAKNVTLGVEGIHTRYRREQFSWDSNPIDLHHELEQLSVMARLSFAWGANTPSIFDDKASAPRERGGDPKLSAPKK